MPVNLPVTRYSGSKRKLISLIWHHLNVLGLEFDSVLDVFGGTGTFAYFAKRENKQVIYNDIFRFNYLIAQALIGNNRNPLSQESALALLEEHPETNYASYVADNFEGIYYPNDENKVIDIAVQNIMNLATPEERASGFYLLFQSCIIKRPYNLFHRKNLNLRTNYSGGTFGNKVTWEKSFHHLFSKFSTELTRFNFDNNRHNIILNTSALDCEVNADLVYIDPPYFQEKGHVTYHAKYHFLEGLANYELIPSSINHNKINKEISINNSGEFESRNQFRDELATLIGLHANSIIVISYRNNGVPTISEIADLLRVVKANVNVINLGAYSYALSRTNAVNEEVLIIGS